MKDGREMRGVVVEQHDDRVVVNVEREEVPVMRDKIREIVFDAPEQNFFQSGESLEKGEHWREALAAYEKALKIRPDFDEAREAVRRVKNSAWSRSATGPDSEVEKRQSLYESWGKVASSPKKQKNPERETDAFLLNKIFGLTMTKTGDWVYADAVISNKDAALAGLEHGDCFVAIDGRSLRYLTVEEVGKSFLTPRYGDFTLEFQRNITLRKTGFEKDVSEFGMQVELESRGLVVRSVTAGGPADQAGLKENDLLESVNGVSTRYLVLNKLTGALCAGPPDHSGVSLLRHVTLSRR